MENRPARVRWATCVATALLLGLGCGDRGASEPTASLAMQLSLPAGVPIASLELTVFDQNGTCTVDGDAEGNALTDLSQLDLPIGQATTIHVSPGRRTFFVVGYDAASNAVARGCSQATLTAGGTTSVTINLHEYPGPPDAGPDAPLPDAGPDAAPDATPPDAMRPAGDTCAIATPLVSGVTVPVDLTGLTDDETGTCAGAGGSPDMIFTYTLTEARHVTISVDSTFDAAVSVRTPTCVDEPSEIQCQNSAGAGGSELIDVRTQPAGTYYVVLDAADGAGGTGFITFTSQPAPSPGDSCVEVQTLPSGTSTAQSLATSYLDDDAGTCGGSGGRDRVYAFTITGSKHVNISTQATFAHVLYMHATSCAAGAEQACQPSATSGGAETATLDFPNLPGDTYYVFVDGATAADSGTFDITLTITSPVMPPGNDTCVTATALAEGLALPGTLDGAVDDTSVSCGGGVGDVFYRIDLTTNRAVTITLTSAFDTSLTLRSGTCAAPTEMQCVNGTAAGEQIMIDNLAAGTYYLVVEGVAGGTGAFTIGYTTSAPIIHPANDTCAGAITLTPGVARTGDNLHNSVDDADGTCGDTTSGDVVYSFTIPSGVAKTARVSVTNASGFDPVVYLRSGTCGGSELGCSQASTGNSEILTLPGLAPGTYFVWIDAMGGEAAPATFDIVVDLFTAGDGCALPTTLAAGATTPISLTGMVDDEAGSCAPPSSLDTVLTYTTTSASHVTITVNTDFDAAVSIRSSTCTSEASEQQCQNSVVGAGNEVIDVRNQAAGTYYVVIDSVDGVPGSGFVTLTVSPPPPAGDSCVEVQTLATGTTTSQSLSSSYADDSSGTCGGAGGRDRVYTFSIAGAKHVNIATQATFAHSLYLRAGACATGSESACQGSTFSAGSNNATVDIANLAGGTYYVFVDANGSATGTFDITLTVTAPTTPPSNDTCSGATLLAEGLALPGALDGSTNDTAVSCVAGANNDVFYKITLATNRYVTITLTSSFDTSLTLRSGTCASPTEMQCVNATTVGEQIVVENLAAGTYYLVVEAVGGATGSFSIGYTTAAPIIRPTNDQCAGAIALSSGVTRVGDTIHNGLDDADGSCGDTSSGDVVYSFTIPPTLNQRARVTVSNANGFDPVLYMRSGSCGGGELGCAQTGTGAGEQLDLPNLAPGTYYVWVDALGGETAPGTFDILLELLTAVPPPSNDTCTSPDTLVAGTPETWSTVGAADNYDLSCLTFDSRDTVHSFDTTALGARSVLVTVTPLTPLWEVAAALRSSASCTTSTSELSCIDDGYASRYILRPNLAGGVYDVVVDGNAGATGDYTIQYDVRPADTTFGYWVIDTTGTYADVTGGTNVAIPLTNWGVDTGTGPGDEWSQSITLPFTFDYYGTSYTTVIAYSNMFLNFGTAISGTESYVNDCPMDTTAPNDAIAPFWDDGISRTLYPSQVVTKTDGTAPNRRFIIEYKDFDQLSCGATTCFLLATAVNHQIILYESGDIEFRYGPRTAPTVVKNCTGGNGGAAATQHLGSCATVGLEGQIAGPSTDVDQVQCNTASPSVTDGRVIYYVHPR